MIFCENYKLPEDISSCNPDITDLADPYEVILSAIADSIKPPPPVDYVEWAKTNVSFDNDNQYPGPYDPSLFPFFSKPLRCLQTDHP